MAHPCVYIVPSEFEKKVYNNIDAYETEQN